MTRMYINCACSWQKKTITVMYLHFKYSSMTINKLKLRLEVLNRIDSVKCALNCALIITIYDIYYSS